MAKITRRALGKTALSTGGSFLPHRAGFTQNTASRIPNGGEPGVDLAGMDAGISPGDDFWLYANGNWARNTTIPADRSRWGPWAILGEETRRRLRELLNRAASGTAPDEERKVGYYYTAYMDERMIETKGIEPVRRVLERIAALSNSTELARMLGETLRADVDPFNDTNYHTPNLFGLCVTQDFTTGTRNTGYLLQGGLGLPDREYYLSGSAHMVDIRSKYRAHVATVLGLAGILEPEGKANRVMALEMKIARAHASLVESQNVENVRSWTRADFGAKARGIDWAAFFVGAGLNLQTLLVWQPEAIAGEATLVDSEPLEDWKAYLTFATLEQASPVLPASFAYEWFAFHRKALYGIPEQPERWKRAVDATNRALGFAAGRIYVGHYFVPEHKEQVERIVENIMSAFSHRIDALQWMSSPTKAEAKAKLRRLKVHIGYPEQWRDYSALEIHSDDAYGNQRRSEIFEYRRSIDKLNQPVDRDEWWINPQTINALHLPVQISMIFPAAILRPPFFDPRAPAAANYGSIGAIVGHEVSHGFDVNGAKFDSLGRRHRWWTAGDYERFETLTSQLVAQFETYQPLPNATVNGKQTLDENIADIAGLAVAYDAWKASLRGASVPEHHGLTGDQQFFIAYAQSWRSLVRDEALRNQVATDVHAPDRYRANTVRNLDAWYAAFDVKQGHGLFLAPSERTVVW